MWIKQDTEKLQVSLRDLSHTASSPSWRPERGQATQTQKKQHSTHAAWRDGQTRRRRERKRDMITMMQTGERGGGEA